MRTREELDRELHWYDGGTAQAEQMQKHLRELALDQRDLLVEIRELLKESHTEWWRTPSETTSATGSPPRP